MPIWAPRRAGSANLWYVSVRPARLVTSTDHMQNIDIAFLGILYYINSLVQIILKLS